MNADIRVNNSYLQIGFAQAHLPHVLTTAKPRLIWPAKKSDFSHFATGRIEWDFTLVKIKAFEIWLKQLVQCENHRWNSFDYL